MPAEQLPAETATYRLRGINPNRVHAVQQFAGEEIIDVGCGSGAYVLRFADERPIYGVDHIAYPTWTQRPGLFAISAADRLPFADSSTDTILSFEVLEHLSSPGRALAEYHRVARKNVIVTVPNCTITEGFRQSNLLYSHWEDRTHVNFFDLDAICALVAECGFVVKESRLINPLSLAPLVAEASGLRILGHRRARPLVERFLSRQYFITCLVVGERC